MPLTADKAMKFAGPRPPEYPQTFEVSMGRIKFRYTVEESDTKDDIMRKIEDAWREALRDREGDEDAINE